MNQVQNCSQIFFQKLQFCMTLFSHVHKLNENQQNIFMHHILLIYYNVALKVFTVQIN